MLGLHHPTEPFENAGDATDLPAHRVDAFALDGAVTLSRQHLDLALQQLCLIEDHRQGIVDLVGESDRHLAQGRKLVLAQDLAQILRESDRPILLAGVVIEHRS